MTQITRRGFVKATAIASVAVGAPTILSAKNPNSKLNVAYVGVGGKGATDLRETNSHKDTVCVALCDTDRKILMSQFKKKFKNGKKAFSQAKAFTDWREMFDKLGNTIDAVVCATPDHMHAPVCVTAMMKGKHVYCQKPLTWSVYESRRMAEISKEKGLITQMGTQNASTQGKQLGAALLKANVLGKVKAVYAWSDRPIWPQGGPNDFGSDPVPANLDWDKWLGVAPARAYKDKYPKKWIETHWKGKRVGRGNVYHSFGWRGWYDFGCGAVGDMCCHIVDTAFYAYGLTQPLTVIAEPKGISSDGQMCPASQIIRFTFPGNTHTVGETLPVTWLDGGLLPSWNQIGFPASKDKVPQNWMAVVCEKGTMMLQMGGGMKFSTPEAKDLARTFFKTQTQIKSMNHYHSWVDGCFAGKKVLSNFEFGGNLTETLLLGTLASKFPKMELKWDPKAMKITNNAKATGLLRRKPRKGWEVKGLDS